MNMAQSSAGEDFHLKFKLKGKKGLGESQKDAERMVN